MKKDKQLRQKNTQELKVLLVKKRQDLVKARLDLKLKRIKNVHQSQMIRKEIARIMTILKEEEFQKEVKKEK